MRSWRAFLSGPLLGAFSVLALMLGVIVLLSGTGWTVLKVFGDDYRLSLEPGILFALLLACLIAVDWPWSSRWSRTIASMLRFAVIGVTLIWLIWCLFVGRPTRQAIETSDRIIEYATIELSPYASGVYTMAREVAVGMDEAWLPILILLWLAAAPGFRTLFQIGRERAAERPRGDVTM